MNLTDDTHKTKDWQLKLAEKSFKKREKLRILESLLLPLSNGALCLDLGCAKGSLSYYLRNWGGRWVSVDLDRDNVLSTLNLVGPPVIQVEPLSLPFRKESFDVVVSMDFLEHVMNDETVMDEMVSLLKPGGRLIVGTPVTGKYHILNRVKPRLGLTLDLYGHVREGYNPDNLTLRLKQRGIQVEYVTTYARFITEFIEMVLNWMYIRSRGGNKHPVRRDGIIAPATAEEFSRISRKYQLYTRVYPFLWGISRLDFFLRPWKGYALILAGRKVG